MILKSYTEELTQNGGEDPSAARTRPKITSIEIIQYELTLQDVAPEPTIGIPVYKPGSVMQRRRHAIRIHSDTGVTGAYSGGSAMDYAAIAGFASCLLGRNPLQREDIYNDFKQAMRQQARMGVGVVDIALWDLAGKYHDAPIYELLGGSQKKLPYYASTYLGDYEPGG
jgi:L-alanine-DL-glutamate epimerase-like enolase superfamily enzyme